MPSVDTIRLITLEQGIRQGSGCLVLEKPVSFFGNDLFGVLLFSGGFC